MMPRLDDLPLSQKLVIIITGVSGTSLLLASLLMISYDLHRFQVSQVEQLTLIADLLGQNSAAAMAFNDNRAAADILASSRLAPAVFGVCLYLQDDYRFARYSRDSSWTCDEQPPSPGLHEASFGELTLCRAVMVNGERAGTVVVHSHFIDLNSRLLRYAAIVFCVLLNSSIVAFLLATRLQKVITRPIHRLVAIARAVSRTGNYSLRAAGQTEDEIGQLVVSFNEMLREIEKRDGKLEEQQQSLQQEVARQTADLRLLNADLHRAKDAAERASRAKSDFLANMSQEIRTPMNGVLGMVELTLDSQLTPEQREYLLMAKLSGESLLALINDLLDFSKIEAGKLELEVVEFDLRELVESVAKTMSLCARQKGLELNCVWQGDRPVRVRGDAARLRQVLVNLLGNAIKFTPCGAVGIQVRPGEPRLAGQSEFNFCVADTGIGIPADKREAIFQPFLQADSSMTRKYGGTGLGLAIVSRLVTMMGGRIWLESELGRGSQFFFTVSLEAVGGAAETSAAVSRPAPDATGSAAPAAEDSDSPLHILIGEDNAVNQLFLRRALERMGHITIVAANGREAVELCCQQSFDLIFMDVQMPEMDGYTATREIRRLECRTGRHTPIIAMTAHALKGDREKCLSAGMDDYLSKPAKLDEIRKAIHRAVRHEPAPPQAPAAVATAGVRQVGWDRTAALHRVGGDEALLNELIGVFFEEYPELAWRLREALARGDMASLREPAHTLKGSLSYLGLSGTAGLAQKIELAIQSDDAAQAADLVDRLMAEIESLQDIPRPTAQPKGAAHDRA
jgi:signal transduction histidine kinase/CheY-like chemotaxis protein/HPt (histidine-containing phosphotransfer) domain-containing protein